MKHKFTKEVDGITYQGELPLDVSIQLKLSQLYFFEQKQDDKIVDRLEIATQIDSMIIETSNIVKGEKELLVKGTQNNGLEAKHLRVLTLLYRQELIIPLL